MEKSTLETIAQDARPNLDSYRNCGAINTAIYERLQEEGIECQYVEGNLTRYSLRGEGPEHAFVVLTDSRLDSPTPIIVDGAIQQFCTERKEKGEVFFTLGDKSDLPTVAVVGPNDELSEHYLY